MKWWELHKGLESPYFKRSKWQNLRQPFGKSPTTQAASSLHPKWALLRKACSDGQGQNKTSSLKFWLSMQFWNHIRVSQPQIWRPQLTTQKRGLLEGFEYNSPSYFQVSLPNEESATGRHYLSRLLHTRPKHTIWSLLQSSDSSKYPLAFLAKRFPWHQL